MKRLSIFCCALVAFVLQASAGWITNDFSGTLANGGYIPDNSTNGWASTMTLSGNSGLTVQDVQVNFTVSGGYNGDLYGYLVHDDGFVVLLNRVGKDNDNPFGYSNSGFTDVTLNGTASTSINSLASGGSYSSTTAIASGTYQAQGTTFSSFTGTAVDGSWSLFFADLSSGDISQVTGWSLQINAVPEPTTWAMIFFGAAFAGRGFVAWRKKKV
jgi:subtilisin-like proprotein convertase family protein